MDSGTRGKTNLHRSPIEPSSVSDYAEKTSYRGCYGLAGSLRTLVRLPELLVCQ